MTQVPNYAVPPGTRASVRQGINAVLAALRDDNAGPTAPPNPVPGMMWLDTSTTPPTPRRRNAGNTVWESTNPDALTITEALSELSIAQRATALTNLGLTATAAQINPMQTAFPNGVLIGENANRAPSAANFDDTIWWPASITQAGITAVGVNGVDEKGPFRDVTFTGVATGDGLHFAAYSSILLPGVVAAVGQNWTASATIERIAGALSGSSNFRVRLFRGNAAGTWTGTNDAVVDTPSEKTYSASAVLAGADERVTVGLLLTAQIGQTINVTYRVRGLQLDQASARVAYRYLPATPAQARTALALGTAATVNTGAASGNIPLLSTGGVLPLAAMGFTGSLAQTGWRRTPDGLIEQWGVITTNASGNFSIGFPLVFPNALHTLHLTINTTSPHSSSFQSQSTAGAFIQTWTPAGAAAGNLAVNWRALGR